RQKDAAAFRPVAVGESRPGGRRRSQWRRRRLLRSDPGSGFKTRLRSGQCAAALRSRAGGRPRAYPNGVSGSGEAVYGGRASAGAEGREEGRGKREETGRGKKKSSPPQGSG